MFRIRASQLDRFGALALDEFDTRMTHYFIEAFPAETKEMDVGDWVERNVRAALDHGLDLEPVVAQYLLLCLKLGENAPDELEWFAATMKRKDLAPDGKMRVLVRTMGDLGIADVERFVMKTFA